MNPKHEAEVERLNRESKESLEQAAAKLREKLIDTAFKGMKVYLEQQEKAFDEIASRGYPVGEKLEYYILDDLLAMPFDDDEPQRALTLLLTPDVNLGTVTDNRQYMKVAIPIPDDVVIDEYFDIDSLPMPTKVAFEIRGLFDGTRASYEVDQNKVRPFVNAAESGEQVTTEDADGEWEIHTLSLRVDSGAPLLASLQETVTNWTAIAQRVVVIDEAFHATGVVD